MAEAAPSIRLDKWLWQARLCKSRALAAKLVAAGAVRVNTVRVSKPATAVRVGDGLSFALGGRVRAVRVLALGTRRGPAAEAQALYDDLEANPGPAAAAASPPLEPDPEADK
jgi:ribosome-associated heat shock protein Hsp15